ncbi:hypothetical protein JZ751_006366 [Albula glossodonta]|uniref:Uncharacterized protein n=1 Tax=Albula glossodonta TaxID=121402 RepID=A0A8T2N4P4_9TELE|nr:hypothetical protein JZ751_006366 [Albula glossodonta]
MSICVIQRFRALQLSIARFHVYTALSYAQNLEADAGGAAGLDFVQVSEEVEARSPPAVIELALGQHAQQGGLPRVHIPQHCYPQVKELHLHLLIIWDFSDKNLSDFPGDIGVGEKPYFSAILRRVLSDALMSSSDRPTSSPLSSTPIWYTASPRPSWRRHFICVAKCSKRAGEGSVQRYVRGVCHSRTLNTPDHHASTSRSCRLAHLMQYAGNNRPKQLSSSYTSLLRLPLYSDAEGLQGEGKEECK